MTFDQRRQGDGNVYKIKRNCLFKDLFYDLCIPC
jgi:hypothetical protein